ncbi:DUF4062 domain-containing protein [Burkholderia gladioli]|uniref:DUF4062 domain-containing protein n=1 Tax=Burkholderia gladioli TaxID=28095 RepID=UPI0024461A23|nr:DUF4062 domain-containing protein [Burkholderia gladioli]
MATPRVFISSTCYDLKYIRENLRYFVRTLGYEPILSEDGSIFYNPAQHTHDACLTEIPNTQMFVLIIGGRYGGKYLNTENSITNAEYREAIRLKIPVFALVESAVYNEHHLYLRNKTNADVDLTKLTFPAVDSLKIFEFVDEVRGSAVNNAIVPFRDFGDIETYLRQQWAAMMFDFLSNANEAKRVADTLSTLSEMNARIEMLSKQILVSVGTEDAKVDAALYEEMMAHESIRDLAYWGTRPSPAHVLVNSNFRACAKSLGMNFKVEDKSGSSISSSGSMSRPRFTSSSADYRRVRQSLIDLLNAQGITPDQYLTRRPKVLAEVDDDA